VREHLASLVEEFRRRGGATAVVAHRGNRRYATSYAKLAEFAGRFAADLDRRGIGAGERVVLWGENSAEWIGVFFGCLLRGVLVVPLDAAGSAEFAKRAVADTQARLVVGDARLVRELSGVEVASFGEWAQAMPPPAQYEVSAGVVRGAAFQIVFTSGTTSEPKGIVHTHRNVLASLQPIEDEIVKYRKYERWVHPLRFLHSLPLSHVFGQFMGLWVPALLGAEVHFSDRLEPSSLVSLLKRERISVLIAVPRIQQLLRAYLLQRFGGLAQDLEVADGLKVWARWWRFWRVHAALGWKFWAVISGGAALPEEMETFWQRLGLALIQGYGMTETAALVTLNHPFKISRGTIGKALPGREVKIGADGEILVRGDIVAKATWQHGAMQQRESEWLATGDLATEDEAGSLRFLGRKGDTIVTGAGMNVHPADLETVLLKQANMRAAVVVGCPFAGGMEPVAAVVFAGSDAALNEAVTRANQTLAEFQRIRRVVRWPEAAFPYTSTGKLLRRQVRAWVCSTLAGQAAGTAAGSDVLLELIAGITGEQVTGGDELRLSEDLHLDSLARVQLQSAVEQRLGVELADDAIAQVKTVGALRQLLGVPTSVGIPAAAASPTEPEDLYPRWALSGLARWARILFIELAMRPLVWVLAKPRITRLREANPQTVPPMLVIANHITAYDGALVLYALPRALRSRMAVAMSGEMLRDLRLGRNQGSWFLNLLAPLGYWLVTALFNVFPLPRQAGFRRSFAFAGEAMDRGYSVLVFPEGTRSKDGTLARFRPGTGLLAQQSRVPVLPVALAGLGELRQCGRWFRSGKLEVRVGPVIETTDLDDPGELTETFEGAIRALLEHLGE
jgi:long-chain acyl-CoA synthetase